MNVSYVYVHQQGAVMLDQNGKEALIIAELTFERLVAGHEKLVEPDVMKQVKARRIEYDKTMSYDEFVSHMLNVLESLLEVAKNQPLIRRRTIAHAMWEHALSPPRYPTTREEKFDAIHTKFWELANESDREYDQLY
jgi:hypothetical protein